VGFFFLGGFPIKSQEEEDPLRTPGLPVRDYAGGHNNRIPRRPKLSTIDVPAKTIFERLNLFSGPRQFALFVTMPSAPTPPRLNRRLFVDFHAIFSRVAPEFFCKHNSPSLLTHFQYPRPPLKHNPNFSKNGGIFHGGSASPRLFIWNPPTKEGGGFLQQNVVAKDLQRSHANHIAGSVLFKATQ